MKLQEYLAMQPKQGRKGPASRIAEQLGVSATVVRRWADESDPAEPGVATAVKIEQITGGLVTVFDLRDDAAQIWPDRVAMKEGTQCQSTK